MCKLGIYIIKYIRVLLISEDYNNPCKCKNNWDPKWKCHPSSPSTISISHRTDQHTGLD